MTFNKLLENKEQKFGVKLDVNTNRISAIAYFLDVKNKDTQIYNVNGIRIFIRTLSKEQYEKAFLNGEGKIVFPYYYFADHSENLKDIVMEYHKNGVHAELLISKEKLDELVS